MIVIEASAALTIGTATVSFVLGSLVTWGVARWHYGKPRPTRRDGAVDSSVEMERLAVRKLLIQGIITAVVAIASMGFLVLLTCNLQE